MRAAAAGFATGAGGGDRRPGSHRRRIRRPHRDRQRKPADFVHAVIHIDLVRFARRLRVGDQPRARINAATHAAERPRRRARKAELLRRVEEVADVGVADRRAGTLGELRIPDRGDLPEGRRRIAGLFRDRDIGRAQLAVAVADLDAGVEIVFVRAAGLRRDPRVGKIALERRPLGPHRLLLARYHLELVTDLELGAQVQETQEFEDIGILVGVHRRVGAPDSGIRERVFDGAQALQQIDSFHRAAKVRSKLSSLVRLPSLETKAISCARKPPSTGPRSVSR